MPIEFACESCNKLLRVPDGSGGLSCECPACRTLLEIPDPADIKLVQTSSGQDVGDKLQIACPKCGVELACSRALLGTKGQCKNCKYIFTIAADSSTTVAAASPDTGWIFTCPECDQLFAGNDEMQGRRGKCHSCGEVFTINLRRAAEPELGKAGSSKDFASGANARLPEAARPPEPSIPPRPLEPSSSPKAHKPPRKLNDLKKPKPSKQSPASSGRTGATGIDRAAVPGTGKAGALGVGGPANASIRMTCESCRGVMEVPASSAGMTTACPYCQLLLEIPTQARHHARTGAAISGRARGAGTDPSHPSQGAGTDPGQSAGKSAGTDPSQVVALGTGNAADEPMYMGGGVFDLGAAGENPYAAPVPDLFATTGTAPGISPGYPGYPSSPGPGAASQAKRRDAIVYLLPGVFISLFGVLQILGVVAYILSTLASISQDERLNASQPGVQGAIIFIAIWGVAVFVLSIVQLIGGICMARRRALTLSRIAAIIACLPCFTCLLLNMPFGVWGLVVCLTGSAKRDFR